MEVVGCLLKTTLKSKDRGIRTKAVPRLASLFQITPFVHNISADAVGFINKIKRKEGEETAIEDENARKTKTTRGGVYG